MAAVAVATSFASSTDASTYAGNPFTAVADDVLVTLVVASGTTIAATMTDNQGGTWVLARQALFTTSADSIYLFVRNELAANVSHTTTFDCTGDGATGCEMVNYRIALMTRTGAAAVRQTAIQENQGAATPAPVFAAAALTENPTIGVVGNNTNPAGLTPPTSWTEGQDIGFATPAKGCETAHRNSGFTGTTITWGSSSASAFGAIIAEFDTSELTQTVSPSLLDQTAAMFSPVINRADHPHVSIFHHRQIPVR
jgi:hypothetical protein